VGRDSSVGTTTRYGLDGPAIKSRWGRDFPHPSRPTLVPTQPPIQWVPGLFPGVKRPGRGVEHPPHLVKQSKPMTSLDKPWGSQEVEAPIFQDNRHMKVARLSAHAPVAFTPRKYSWYSFPLEAESTPGPCCGRKDYVYEKFHWHHRESNPRPSGL